VKLSQERRETSSTLETLKEKIMCAFLLKICLAKEEQGFKPLCFKDISPTVLITVSAQCTVMGSNGGGRVLLGSLKSSDI